jgi:hypothetical protein
VADVVAGLTLNNVLAITTAFLLVFVSGGVLYLSTIEWRDRRRRQKPVASSSKSASKSTAKGTSGKPAGAKSFR